jgi:predicted peptidase
MVSIPSKPGVYEQQLEPNNHRYTLSIPEGFNPAQPTPLIMALHWGGPVTPYTGKNLLLGLIQPALYELDAIMVAPDRNMSDWDNLKSEEEILTLYRYLQSQYLIDSARTLITGYSLGGIGTWRLAAYHQDKFTAALPMAATPPDYVLDSQWKIPIYVIHGQKDEYFPLSQTQAVIDQLRSNGADIEYIVVDSGTHFDTGGYVKPLHDAIPWIRRVWKYQ